MANKDRNKTILLELGKLPENNQCADCSAPDPDWASYKLGVFVCLNCSGVHRNLSNISRVKSIQLDFWDDELVKFMKTNGNATGRAIYEKAVPAFYYRPQQEDCAVLREQWIRAKYERMEFTGETKYPPLAYTTGFYEGMLWKKGKEKGQFQRRKFVLSEKEFTLSYFNKEDEIVNWFNAIRAARFAYLKTAYPTGSDKELRTRITRNYLKEGYMEKTGPMQKEMFKKRWFILDSQDRKLLYFKSQLDAEELGVVFIGTETNGYSVSECIPKRTRGNRWRCGVTVDTPDRQFVFMCEQEREQREWVEALREVISKPMQPQDYTSKSHVTSIHTTGDS
ncbi:arf-GAP with dual PH domain-containing protein 1-like isoform X3 [Oncorhynchus masou masou]|uniref:arf-GAP with dual PH domain-containing protein 1-like isoform X3 n=1 Tax=Oncorhynchus masou masou TaxID=90313 RepID=UPI0031834CE4